MVESIQIAKISASSIVVYNKTLEQRSRTDRQKENESNLRDQEYNGYMSPKTSQKVRKMLDSWLTSIELKRKELAQGNYYRNSKVTFVTLTLSSKQKHSDNEIKRRMLNRFIIELRREKGVYNYFWRAEPQKNGNIHFHILIDKYVHWKDIRDKWNTIQGDNGYLTEFYNKFMHLNPNSTDIHGLGKVKCLSAYVVKYCCKIKAGRKVNGRIWGSSDSLRKIGAYEVELTNEVRRYIEAVENEKGTKVVVKEDFTLIFVDNEKKLSKFSNTIFKDWKAHYSNIFNDLYTDIGRQKAKEEFEKEKQLHRHSAPMNRLPITKSSRVLVGSQLPLFATQTLVHSR